MLTVFRSSPRFFALVLLGAAGLLLAGCDGGPTWNEDDPAVGPTGDVVVPPTTNVLDEEMVEETLQSEASGRFGKLPDELVFSGDAPMGDVEVGDVVVTGVSEKTPVGFLRKVTGRREENGQIVLETRQAALSEAIDRGSVDTSITISENTIDAKRLYDGLKGNNVSGPDGKAFGKTSPLRKNSEMRKALGGFCAGSADSLCVQFAVEKSVVTAAAAMAFRPTIDFRLDIGLSGVEEVVAAVEPGARLTTGLILSASFGSERTLIQKELIDNRRLQTFVVTVGPVPVVITPVTELNFQGNASLGVTGAQAYVQQEVSLRVGARYDGSSWSPIKDFSENSKYGLSVPTNIDELVDAVTLNIEPSLVPDFTLRMYETAGPGFEPVVFGLGQIKPGEKPLWKIFGGVRGSLDVDVEPLGVDLAEYGVPIAQFKTEIASGTEPSGGNEFPDLLFPPGNPVTESGNEKVSLTWQGVDAAAEYHVFRAREPFGKGLVRGTTTIPLVDITRVNDDPIQDTTCTDSGLENGTKYHYRVTAVDEEGNGTEGSEMVTGTPLPEPPDRP